MSIFDLPRIESPYLELKEKNREISITEYNEGLTHLRSYPRVIFVELTQNCNLYCPMCRSKTRYDPQKNMSWELFKKVADELFPYAELVDLRGFGESSMLKDFARHVDYASRFGCQIKLFTNLAIKRDDVWKKLASVGATLAVSFDGATKSTFEKIRAGAKFEVVLSNLRNLSEWYQHFGFNISEHVYFSTTLQQENLCELIDILELMHRNGIRLIKLFPIACSEHDPRNLKGYRLQVEQTLKFASDFAKSNNIVLELGESLHPELTLTSKVIDRCIHPWTYCVVDYQGKVGFCDNLISMPQNLVGDLNTHNFDQIWNSPLYQELRRQHLETRPIGQRFNSCNHCYKYRYNEIEHQSIPLHSIKIVGTNHGELTPASYLLSE